MTKDLEARVELLGARIVALEAQARIAMLEKAAKPRRKHEYTDEEKKAIRARLVTGQQAKKAATVKATKKAAKPTETAKPQ